MEARNVFSRRPQKDNRGGGDLAAEGSAPERLNLFKASRARNSSLPVGQAPNSNYMPQAPSPTSEGLEPRAVSTPRKKKRKGAIPGSNARALAERWPRVGYANSNSFPDSITALAIL